MKFFQVSLNVGGTVTFDDKTGQLVKLELVPSLPEMMKQLTGAIIIKEYGVEKANELGAKIVANEVIKELEKSYGANTNN